jgi:hypothetical protein
MPAPDGSGEKVLMRKGIPFTVFLGVILGTICLATAPTVINSTDLLVNSRSTINTNFSNLYSQSSGLVDCSGVVGRFVVTLNGGGVLPICGTLTWANVLALSGTPSTFVTSFNARSSAVTLQSSDVAAVEQDLRNSATPNFAGLVIGGNISVSGTSALTNATISGTLGITGLITTTAGITGNLPVAGAVQATGATSTFTCGGCGGYAATFTTTGTNPGVSISSGSGNSILGVSTGAQSALLIDSSGSCQIRSNWGILCSGGANDLRPSGSPTFAGVTYTTAAPTVSMGQVGFGGSFVASSSCGTLAGAAGCLVINVAGITHYVPYY